MLNKLPKFMTLLSFVSLASLGLWSCEQEPVVVDVTDIDISMTSATLVKGETVRLTAVVVPSNATETAIEWVSVDPTIAKVDLNGLVTALDKGETIIMARSGEIVKECIVTVTDIPLEGIVLDKDTLDIKVGDNAKLAVTVLPEGVEGVEIEWSSSNTKVVTVDNSGQVMGQSSGEAVVTASAGDYKASCRIYVMGDVQVGDYYYADGRWFSTPIEGQTPIAIVFYVGDPTKEDGALKEDHPECTHGLALALFGENSSKWQSKASTYEKNVSDWQKENAEASKYVDVYQSSQGEYLNKIVGYSNTKVYELFNEDEANAEWPVEAIHLIHKFRDENPLPEGTSGWYIPSIKELSLVCTGDFDGNIAAMGSEDYLMQNPANEMSTFLNEKIFKIPGAYLFTPNYFMSSTEAGKVRSQYGWTTYNQWMLKMAYGYVYNSDKTSMAQAIRPVFAF